MKKHSIDSPNILGIDPGLERIGWCVINVLNDALIVPGIILTSSQYKLWTRLYDLQEKIEQIIQDYSIKILAIEKVIATKKIESKLNEVLQARGVILSLAGKYNLLVDEISPNTIKKAVSGSGKAKKEDIKNVIQKIYKIPTKKEYTDDVYDAIAIALTCKQKLLK